MSPSPSPTRIAIYARYSSDLQNPSSVDDQIALCRRLAREHFAVDAADRLSIYADAAISGATTTRRPDVRRLLSDAATKRFDLVIAEGLDRISRDLSDIAQIYKILKYHGIGMWTAHEGHVTELHIAFKGAMNALYLEDLGDKLRRAQTARINAGYALSACPYGYRIVRGIVDDRGRNVNGVREIDPVQAAIVRRIYREYASGLSPVKIIRGLEADGIPGIGGRLWLGRSLAGYVPLEEGILRNEMYLGRLVYNKRVTLRDPITGKKRYKIQPKEAWARVDVPHLRIIDDDLWQAVRTRMQEHARPAPPRRKLPLNMVVHNQHALTGWVRCGVCGSTKSIANASRYVCNRNRFERLCRNSRGTKEPVLLEAVFAALLDRVQRGPEFRPVFMRVFAHAMDRSAALRAEEIDITASLERFMDAIGAGVDTDLATSRVLSLQTRLKAVRDELSRTPLPNLPREAEIRTRLTQSIVAAKVSGDIPRQRTLFDHLLSSITLTPLPDKAHGESVSIVLREEGWPDFWRMIVA